MSVADILKKHGNWMPVKELVTMVERQFSVGDRQAYREIKQAWKDGEIRKLVLPDRSVLCGLPEWPFLPKPAKTRGNTVSFQDAFLYRCFKELDKIAEDILDKEANSAYVELKAFQAKQPKAVQDRMQPYFQEYLRRANKIDEVYKGPYLGERWRIRDSAKREELLELLSKISEILHEQVAKKNAQ